jgi:hypothetical protein
MPQTLKIISSAPNINDVPKIAEMVRMVRENIRSKPKPSTHIYANNTDLATRIRKILTER